MAVRVGHGEHQIVGCLGVLLSLEQALSLRAVPIAVDGPGGQARGACRRPGPGFEERHHTPDGNRQNTVGTLALLMREYQTRAVAPLTRCVVRSCMIAAATAIPVERKRLRHMPQLDS